MLCKQQSFELVKKRILETLPRLPALDSVLRWHLEALAVTYKYSVVFSSQFPLILNDCLMHLIIYLFLTSGNLFPFDCSLQMHVGLACYSNPIAKLVLFPPSCCRHASTRPNDYTSS